MIRPATVDDIPALVTLGTEFFVRHPFATLLGFDAASLAQTVRGLLENPAACVLVAERAREVCGCLVGGVTPLYFHHDLHVATELAWFVTDAARQQGLGHALYRVFEQWAKDAGAQAVVMTALHGDMMLEAVYAHEGYLPYETNYVKRL